MIDMNTARNSAPTRPLHQILADLSRHTLAFVKATEGLLAGQTMMLNASQRLVDTGNSLANEFRDRRT